MMSTEMPADELKVSSELHRHSKTDLLVKPTLCSANVVTGFAFKFPSNLTADAEIKQSLQIDEDGDILVQRRNGNILEGVIIIEQSHSTTLELVGLQVWRGALALADFVLCHGPSLLKNRTVMELGSGTGITSIAAAMFANEVVCTDVDIGGILELIKVNAARNSKYMKAKFTVLGLDFYARQWSNILEAKLTEVSVVLVADVIYDNDLTEAFVETLTKILSIPPRKTVYIALEKRYVFTIADLNSVAPCYEHFLICLQKARTTSVGSHWRMEQLPIDFPQYFNYERVKELVLLKITSD